MGLPESPRWLILKGKEDEAIRVLAALSGVEEDDVRDPNAEILLIGRTLTFRRAELHQKRIRRHQGHGARNGERQLFGSLHHERESAFSSHSLGLCQSDVPTDFGNQFDHVRLSHPMPSKIEHR